MCFVRVHACVYVLHVLCACACKHACVYACMCAYRWTMGVFVGRCVHMYVCAFVCIHEGMNECLDCAEYILCELEKCVW